MKRSLIKSRICSACAVGAAVLAHANVSLAAIIPGMSGNNRSVAESIQTLDFTVNFAVYRRSGGRIADAFGTGWSGFDNAMLANDGGGRALDTQAEYLYVYQLVNDGPGSDPFSYFRIPALSGTVTSFGQWNLSLFDDGGAVTSANAFGNDTAVHSPAASANIGVSNPWVGASGQRLVGGHAQLSAGGEFTFDLDLRRGDVSRIFGFTSNIAPTLSSVSLEVCRDDWACGTVAVPIPEPSGLVLTVVVALGLLRLAGVPCAAKFQVPRGASSRCSDGC